MRYVAHPDFKFCAAANECAKAHPEQVLGLSWQEAGRVTEEGWRKLGRELYAGLNRRMDENAMAVL